ncbi:MAG: alpha/beta hydrolase [Actinomycetota bacterium]
MRSERVAFYAESVEHLRLEGIMELPSGGGPFPGCILCHPHPIGGGSMHIPLLRVIAATLVREGWACLRFNFRGVGDSAGESTGGLRETEDVEGAYRFLAQRGEVDVGDLSLAGWSFGSWVGLRWAVKGGRCRRVALVSPPMVGFDYFHFLESDEVSLPPEILVVAGERDQFASQDKLQELASRLGAELHLLPGADHFLFGREEEVAETIAAGWKGKR